MSERRKFQSQKMKIGVAFAFLLVLGGGGFLIHRSYEPVISQESEDSKIRMKSNRSASNSTGRITNGRSGIRSSHDDVREAALKMDEQLMAKLRKKQQDRQQQGRLSYDSSKLYEDQERVRDDYEDVKKAKGLSDGMKKDFKKHVDNMTKDN